MLALSSSSSSNDLTPATATRTLAGDYLIDIRSGGKWSLYDINTVVDGMDDILAEGNRAAQALQVNVDLLTTTLATSVLTLEGHIHHDDHSIDITTSGNTSQIDSKLFDTLTRIFAQWVCTFKSNDNKHHLPNERTDRVEWQIRCDDVPVALVAGSEPYIFDTKSTLPIIFGNAGEENTEWVEMVTATGTVLGIVPRKLVHSHNLLHRGIGLFVTKDRALDPCCSATEHESFPDLYVHQRTATKRIFPSLYDMFVGGVSGAGESAELTARREVSEELGLTQALNKENDKLSSPILDCVVCTSYNRCLVTLFSYAMDTSTESVAWQEEEVAWGDFVPYPVIVASADQSIQRFGEAKTWPGSYPPVQSGSRFSKEQLKYESTASLPWNEWDYVPDGLLVWEAWLEWRRKNTVNS